MMVLNHRDCLPFCPSLWKCSETPKFERSGPNNWMKVRFYSHFTSLQSSMDSFIKSFFRIGNWDEWNWIEKFCFLQCWDEVWKISSTLSSYRVLLYIFAEVEKAWDTECAHTRISVQKTWHKAYMEQLSMMNIKKNL